MTILEHLKSEKVFSIERDGDRFMVTEECDGWFGEWLTRDELRQLAGEILALADEGESHDGA